MNRAEVSLQWKIAALGFIGALIGGGATLIATYWVLDQQQKVLNQQQIIEQHNIARALYIDISMIEDRLNSSLALSPINKSSLDDPEFFESSNIQFYSKDGLYYVFNKDISRFDSATSADLYIFYNDIIEMEDGRDFINIYAEKYLLNESLSFYDRFLAHSYTENLYKFRMRDNVMKAEKLKQELKQKYHADT